MNFEQLMIVENQNSITAEEKQFVELHRQIMYYGNAAAEFAAGMAMKLKEMRDGKNYLAAGFESFGAYVGDAVGIKERQAYNYIKVYEELPPDVLHSNAKLGVTKLALIASLPEELRAEVIEENDLEDVSVRELRALIAEKENLISEKDSEVEQLTMQLDELREQNADLQAAAAGQPEAPDGSAFVKKLKAQLVKEAEEKRQAAQKMHDLICKRAEEVEKLKQEIAAAKAAPVKVETVTDPETAKKLAETERQLQEKEAEIKKKLEAKEAEIENLKKQLTVASDAAMSKFKVKFEDFQRLGAEINGLLADIDEEKREKCKTALKTIIEGWNL